MKKRAHLLLLVLGLLLLLPCAAHGEAPTLYISGGEIHGEKTVAQMPVDTITPYVSEGIRYVFLPAAWDAGALRIHLIGTEQVTLDGEVYTDGQEISLTVNQKHAVKLKGGASFTIKVMQSANIPAVFLSTESGNIDALKLDKTNKETGLACIVNADGSVEYAGALTHIRTRGNSSLKFAKKSFQIKLETPAGLFGMNADRKWTLLANYLDKSLLRNTLAYAIARHSGAYTFVPGTQAVDLYLNHRYYGSFLLTEKCEIDPDRLDIYDLEKETERLNPKPVEEYPTFGNRLYARNTQKGAMLEVDPEDITGGYLVLTNPRSFYSKEVSGFVTSRGQAFNVDQPKYASEKQVAYLNKLFQSAENALFAEDGIDPDTGRHWTEIIDKNTFVHRYLQAEVTADYDGERPYFYKDRDSVDTKLYCAPVWDQDNTFGAYAPYGNARKLYVQKDGKYPYFWFPQALKFPDFQEDVVRLYRDVYAPALEMLLGLREDPEGVVKSLDEYAAEVRASTEMDHVRWPVGNNRSNNRFNINTGATPEKNVEFIRGWLQRRLEFLNSQWLGED